MRHLFAITIIFLVQYLVLKRKYCLCISKGSGKNATTTLILSRMVGWIKYKFTETNTYMKTSYDTLSHNTSVE